MNNPTLVVLTDRNDLDDQLFGTFASCQDLLRQEPKQAESREDLPKSIKSSFGWNNILQQFRNFYLKIEQIIQCFLIDETL